MFPLHINDGWLQQITAIRDAVTADTNLIRFDNGFYRTTRPGPLFTVAVHPGFGRVNDAVELQIDPATLYVQRVAGRTVERYPSTLDLLLRDAHGIDAALHAVPGNTDKKTRFPDEMLIVFCVAESLRFDHIATVVDQVIKATAGRLQGAGKTLNVGALSPLFKNWERASAAVWRAMSAETRQILALPPAQRSAAQRQHFQRIEPRVGDAGLTAAMRALKVVKLPG